MRICAPLARDRLFRRSPGQSLVEFTFVVPIVLVLLVSVAELGLIFGKLNSLGYASREGARTAAALVRGKGVVDCDSAPANPEVDAVVMAAVQRILTSPNSGIDMSKVRQVRIFRALADGSQDDVLVNTWKYRDDDIGPDIDPSEDDEERIEFTRVNLVDPWPACERDNTSDPPESIGVTVTYDYEFLTPLPAVVSALTGGAPLVLSETTVMALNPTFD